ncbi:MAG: serine hydrolase domain-containing protein, partial [Desulfocucumaceae bacterium]
ALVAHRGEIIYKKSFGYADRAWRVPNRPDTRFMLGSNTKQFTSLLVMQLVEKGLVRLDGEVSQYLPGFSGGLGSGITVRHLLSHTSGIPDLSHQPSFTPHTIVRIDGPVTPDRLEFQPGSSFKYCNTGYCLLGNIIEEITGKAYPEVLRDNILQPLGMQNTGYYDDSDSSVDFARSYTYGERGPEPEEMLDSRASSAAGNIYSTVEDMYLWDQALYTDRLLSERYREMLFTPYLGNYAFGWVRVDVSPGKIKEFMVDPLDYSTLGGENAVTCIVHRGKIAGFCSLILRITNSRQLIVLLGNIFTPVFPEEIACELFDEMESHAIL